MSHALTLSPGGSTFSIAGFKQVYSTQAVESALDELPPILNRMNVYEIEPPDADGARRIAQSIYREIRDARAWGRRFPERLEAPGRFGRFKSPREGQ